MSGPLYYLFGDGIVGDYDAHTLIADGFGSWSETEYVIVDGFDGWSIPNIPSWVTYPKKRVWRQRVRGQKWALK